MRRAGRRSGGLARLAALVSLAGALLLARPARANSYLDDWHPYQTYWGVNWSTAVPVTGMRAGFIDNTGWLGGGFEVQVGVVGRLALGVNCNWNWFDQTFPVLTLERNDFTFTGPVYRTLSAFTAVGTARYYLTRGSVQPYVGAGLGGTWLTIRQQIVNRLDTTDNSGMAAVGEAGILFTVAPRLGLYLSGRYQFNLTTIPGVANPQWVAGQAGVAYYF